VIKIKKFEGGPYESSGGNPLLRRWEDVSPNEQLSCSEETKSIYGSVHSKVNLPYL
jgi:hypothetical protein